MMKRFSLSSGNDYRKLKVVIDAGNGTGGDCRSKNCEAMGREIIPSYCEPTEDSPITIRTDSRIHQGPYHTDEENNADIGVGYDGDADRMVAADSDGTSSGAIN